MFEIGDIARINYDNELWVIIEKDIPCEVDASKYLWRMRNCEHGKRLPNCATAWSDEILLVHRPLLFIGQRLIFRDLYVEVISDFGVRVKCIIIGSSVYQYFHSWNSDIYVGRQIEIFKPALIEYNIINLVSG